MSTNLRDTKPAESERHESPGLDPDELRAEQAGELPERDAMSIISVGGLEGGLPPAGILDGILGSDVPVHALPIDQLPIDRLPVDQLPPVELPGDTLPVEPPVDTLPVDPPILVDPPVDSLPAEPPVDGDPIGIPELPATSADASVKA